MSLLCTYIFNTIQYHSFPIGLLDHPIIFKQICVLQICFSFRFCFFLEVKHVYSRPPPSLRLYSINLWVCLIQAFWPCIVCVFNGIFWLTLYVWGCRKNMAAETSKLLWSGTPTVLEVRDVPRVLNPVWCWSVPEPTSQDKHLSLENFPYILWWFFIRNCCLLHFLTVLSHNF